jgi:23S rRNA (pseudouridine1915-N3)-methyltransferase
VKLTVAAVGQRMPAWVVEAWEDYSRRFPPSLPIELKAVRTVKRARNTDIAAARQAEGEALLAAAPPGALIVALDGKGAAWSTEDLAERLEGWMQEGRDLAFMIGGPDGLPDACRNKAQHCWSLGRATWPHALVRVMLVEQLYRAWSITRNHPYHRA